MSSIFGSPPPPTVVVQPPPPTPAAPTPTPPPTMPDPFSPASQEAARKQQAQATQGGRSSTILTTAGSRASGTIAGGYGGTKLGAS
jgi:hypothetical protein